MPQYELEALAEGVAPVYYAGFKFTWEAEFEPSPYPCRCSCCEFRQILEMNAVRLSCRDYFWGQEDEKPTDYRSGTKREFRDIGEGSEDCTWQYRYVNAKTGAVLKAGYARTGPADSPPPPFTSPPAHPSVLWSGPQCPGHRDAIPNAVPRIRPYTHPKGHPPDPKYVETKTTCKYSGGDTPKIALPPHCVWEWEWAAVGRIIDRCNNDAIKAESRIHVKLHGETGSQSKPIRVDFLRSERVR